MLFSLMYSKLLNNPEQRNPFWISADLFILTILLDNIAYLQWVEVLSSSMHYSGWGIFGRKFINFMSGHKKHLSGFLCSGFFKSFEYIGQNSIHFLNFLFERRLRN